MKDWRHEAACRGAEEPDLWHPAGSTGLALLQIREAKAVCRGCPAMERCAEYALDRRITDGVWGGLSEDERRSILRRRARQRAAS
jgi:WhiB family redox-sensing transcriptional regulator